MSFPNFSMDEKLYSVYWNCRPGSFIHDQMSLYPPFWLRDTYNYYYFCQHQLYPSTLLNVSYHNNVKIQEPREILQVQIDPKKNGEKDDHQKQSIEAEEFIVSNQDKQKNEIRIKSINQSKYIKSSCSNVENRVRNLKQNINQQFMNFLCNPEHTHEVFCKFAQIKARYKFEMSFEDFLDQLNLHIPKKSRKLNGRKWKSLFAGRKEFNKYFRAMLEYFKHGWGTQYFLGIQDQVKEQRNQQKQQKSGIKNEKKNRANGQTIILN